MATHTEVPGSPEDTHLQHHFDTPTQQFDSSKLGMWLFLATELLMFGGLFCAYAVYRGNHPEIFAWGSQLLDTKLGGINTLVLITSSFTMALAVMCAQRGWRWRQVVFLGLTFLGACGFLGIKAIEYKPKFENGLLWGAGFNPNLEYVAHHWPGYHADGVPAGSGEHGAEEVEVPPVDLEFGKKIAYETCASCHGADLQGMPKNGKSLIVSDFIADKSDADLLTFLKVGRPPWDAANTTGVQMPPRGGNPTLDDKKLSDVIAFLRVLQEAGPPEAGAEGDSTLASMAPAVGVDFWPYKSIIPPAVAAPAGLTAAARGSLEPEEHPDLAPPPGAHRFFAVYFMMTGLHGIHVVAGMIFIGWLMIGAAMGRYHPGYFTPVDLGGLFWHLVDLIWIFLFPLFYLI